MKKYIYPLILGAFMLSCAGSSSEEEVVLLVVENNIPSLPSLIAPENNLLCTNNEVILKWQASEDADGDEINYTIEISEDDGFIEINHSLNTKNNTIAVSLEKGKAYYWRVKATDKLNETKGYSGVFKFYTEGKAVQNYAPFLPELIAPALNSVVQSSSVLLKWNAVDVDNDVLTYDVYFGQENPPLQKVGNAQTDPQLSVNVISSTTYYWKVIALDGKGGKTIGQVWRFKTD